MTTSAPATMADPASDDAAPNSAAAQRGSVLWPLSEIITVGFPFCAFKLLTGLLLVTLPRLPWLGWALIALGAIDLLLNSVNVVALLLRRKRALPVCLSDLLAQKSARGRARPDIGLAIDMLLSFALVALMIGCGGLALLPKPALSAWNVAVIFNVLGAGVARLLEALRPRA